MGIRYGRTVGVGKAGNSDVIPNVHPGIGGGGATSPNSSAGCIVTAGADDCHAHLIWPEQSDHALADGTTTMVDNGSRLVFDVSSGGATSFGIFQSATDVSSMNFALFGRRESEPKAVERPIAAGGSSVKIPEDFSAAPVVINQHLVAADCGHFTIHLHTNSIDEFGICEITIAAVERRTI